MPSKTRHRTWTTHGADWTQPGSAAIPHGNTFAKEVAVATSHRVWHPPRGSVASQHQRPQWAPRTTASDQPRCRGDPGLHAGCWGAEVKRTPRLTLRVHEWLGGRWGQHPLQTSRKHKLHRDTRTERPAGGGGTSRTSKSALACTSSAASLWVQIPTRP